ncbi:unnamed protein product, partial [Polarella glacialis]
MTSADSELFNTQVELQAVKKALRDGGAHLGLKGEALTRYLLQLNEKENLLLSKQLRSMAAKDHFEPLLPAAASPTMSMVPMTTTNGSVPPPRPAPDGQPKAFDRESLAEVLTHMIEYEAVPTECAKSLRALSSLAYANARCVGEDDRALPVLLRVLTLHPSEGVVQLTAMRALCNMAYDQAMAMKRLAHPDVMGGLLLAMAVDAEPKETAARASEALARIVAAEVKPEGESSSSPPAEKLEVPAGSSGALVSLFVAASRGEALAREAVPRLLAQLASNEVMEAKVAAEGFVKAEQECRMASEGAGWLAQAKVLSSSEALLFELPAALVEAGAVRAAAGIMTRFLQDATVQLTGIEAMSSLVGNRWAGLRAFADVGGMERVEEAMKEHCGNAIIQTKGVRALGSGVQWPQEVQERARYSFRRAVELTKLAMSQHAVDVELQIASLEALEKYLLKTKCVQEVKESGGEGLVKMMMTTHVDNTK